jgi:hypothetical protein
MEGQNNMINIVAPLLDATVGVATTDINVWSIVIPIIVSAITGGLVAIVSKLLDRRKDSAEELKLTAEGKKLKAEADSIENAEWQKLYGETKTQYADLKKESDEKIAELKKESGEQMDFLKKQISIHSDTLELQNANFETQEQTIKQLKEELEIEKTARQRLERLVKKFQQWAVRNKEELERHQIESIPVELYY